MGWFKKTVYRFSTLSAIQLLTFFFPLALYYVLIDRLSFTLIGQIATWQMLFLILAGLSNYSFPQNLIPLTEQLKGSPRLVTFFWNRLLQVRWISLILILFIGVLFIGYLPKIALYSSFLLIGKLYNPSSLLYILSKNKTLLWYNFFTKISSLGLVFFMVTRDNWLYTNFLIGVSELVVSLFLIYHLKWAFLFSKLKKNTLRSFYIRDKKLFFIQCVLTLILMITIPLTHLFFGAQCAGIVSILEKVVAVIRGVSGNLFFTILPNFGATKKEILLRNIQNSIKKITYFTGLLFLISLVVLFLFKGFLAVKFPEIPLFFYFLFLLFIWFPIMISTPYQLTCLKLSNWNVVYFNSMLQLLILIVGLICLGKLFGVWGIVATMLLHEMGSLFLYWYAVKRK